MAARCDHERGDEQMNVTCRWMDVTCKWIDVKYGKTDVMNGWI